jgi:sugar (pentulose or hexulose) kinase
LTNLKTTPVTAIFDIGRTNKKFFVFDEDYNILQKQQTNLEPTEDEDGFPCEELESLDFWVESKLKKVLQHTKFSVQRLNFSAYGASLVHLDKAGQAVTPLYNYLKDYPEELLKKLYQKYGGKEQFALETSSPPMGMLNSGLQLYWLKHERGFQFKQIAHSLHFPQYLSHLICGQPSTELTSIGCHTGLWNFEEDAYHRWTREEKIAEFFPEIQSVFKTYDTTYKQSSFKTGVGIHDSSSALAPYLVAFDEPFILASTGTWAINLNPFNDEPLTYDELQKDCLCYKSIFGDQVKAARFFLGKEYQHQTKKMSDHFGREFVEGSIELDPKLLKRLAENADASSKLQLEKGHDSGPYPQEEQGDWPLREFMNYKEGYHQLMLDLVSIQVASLKLAEGSKDIKKVIVTGGFSQSEFFTTLLASFLPEKKIYTSSLPHASALGAAMVVNNDTDKERGKAFQEKLGLKHHAPNDYLKGLEYSWA